MGDSFQWCADQEAAEQERRHTRICEERLKKADAILLNNAIEQLLNCLEKQQLSRGTYNSIDQLRKTWFGNSGILNATSPPTSGTLILTL